jgi:hypothetical protein
LADLRAAIGGGLGLAHGLLALGDGSLGGRLAADLGDEALAADGQGRVDVAGLLGGAGDAGLDRGGQALDGGGDVAGDVLGLLDREVGDTDGGEQRLDGLGAVEGREGEATGRRDGGGVADLRGLDVGGDAHAVPPGRVVGSFRVWGSCGCAAADAGLRGSGAGRLGRPGGGDDGDRDSPVVLLSPPAGAAAAFSRRKLS